MGRHRKTDNGPGLMISRQGYNSFLRRLAIANGCPPEQADAAVAMEYPKSTSDTVYELRSRGIAATEYGLTKYSRSNPVRIVGGSLCWTQQDIDDAAMYLAGEGMYTKESRAACRLGRTEKDFLDFVCGLAFAEMPIPQPTMQGRTHDRIEADFDP